MFVVRFANVKSRALSHKPSSACMIARAKGHVRTQASYGNITVLNHLNQQENVKAIFIVQCGLEECPFWWQTILFIFI